ncbi:MAG TPA: vitamin B12 dependent-methionine synthase activation domain-containing protein [Bacteroidales bacterium]|nr:vitamin B12 dependent-methionine synthase activation domain-containing protein [Bacteroidales bacterium]
MGYQPGTSPEPVTLLINEITEELLSFGDIKAEYRIFSEISFQHKEKSLQVEGIVFNIKPIIYRQIKEAEEAALFICTAGPVIGEKSRNSMKGGDLLKGYVYDVIGSEVVEAAADMMQEELKAEAAARGKKITNRFSPGYCGWDVAEQHKLFSFFKDNFCGITLTESALMNPVKSVSGVIGIGKNVRYAPYQCKLCVDKKCIYRNRKI